MRVWLLAASSALLLAPAGGARASDLDEFRVKREAVFGFADKPTAAREGDRVTISFQTTGLCDVTVAVEDPGGRIVRHLACGVLGPNAPRPLQSGSKRQELVWDGKDDRGELLEDKDRLVVRVSLGLKPTFERVLYWEPKKRIAPRPTICWGHTGLLSGLPAPPLLAAAEEGVFVYDGGWADHLRLFDHEGGYVRTVYPFPADKLDKVQGLQWQTAPQDGRRVPVKQGATMATLLTSGDNLFAHGGAGDGIWGTAAKSMAVGGGRVALCDLCLNRLATDGSTGGLPLRGPRTSVRVTRGRESVEAAPRSAALSPDGRWLYLTCLGYQVQAGFYVNYHYLPAVLRLDMQQEGEPQVFAGSLQEQRQGAGDSQFAVPSSVACDREGRVYVSDYMNDRIQVFSPEGKLLASIPAARPAQVMVHQRTGEIYVGSWKFESDLLAQAADQARSQGRELRIEAVLSRLGPLPHPEVRASWPLPLEGYKPEYGASQNHSSLGGWQYRLALDSWARQPTFWLVPGAPEPWEKAGLRLLVERDGGLAVERDFAEDTRRSVGRVRRPAHFRQYLFVNPRTGALYVGERDAGGFAPASTELVRIDPDTGRIAFDPLPMAAYDIAFDLDGMAYLRFEDVVARFDPSDWHEVPWDYGEQRSHVGFGRWRRDVASGLIAPGCRGVYSAVGGMSVSAAGRLALYTYQSEAADAERFKRPDMWGLLGQAGAIGAAGGRKFTPRLYPGRMTGQEVHVWDRHGKLLYEDAIPGVGKVEGGLGIGADDELYIVAAPNRVLDGKPYVRGSAGTWMKLSPGKGRFLCSADTVPVPLSTSERQSAPPDASDGSYMRSVWVEGAEAMYGGIGFFHTNVGQRCMCHDSRFAFDYFARSFLPEPDHYSVAVLDANGNLILRIGQYGNEDSAGPQSRAPLGGDEVGLFDPRYLATWTDRRLFIADTGNSRIVSVWLDYHAAEKVRLSESPGRTNEGP